MTSEVKRKVHFTYMEEPGIEDLQQGDLLTRTPELKAVIEKFHQYYLRDNYTAFSVLSQSCDLVRRKGSCSSEYITICAVRPYEDCILREIRKYQNNHVLRLANAIADKSKSKLKQFIERLLNNNEEDYFYYHKDDQLGISDPLCAFLKLAITFRQDHYDVLLRARAASLKEQFQTKLGWQVGKMYNRVATEDWVPLGCSAEEWEERVNGIVNSNVLFLEEKKVETVRKEKTEADLQNLDKSAIIELVRTAKSVNRRVDAVDAILDELVGAKLIQDEQKKSARDLLLNNPIVQALPS